MGSIIPSFNVRPIEPLFFFYPDVDAYKVVLVYKQGSTYSYKEFNLKEHSGLNGAYFSQSISKLANTISFDSTDSGTKFQSYQEQAVSNPWISLPSSLYTSNLGNPYTFLSSNIEEVGDGRIIALAPLALALSQEQFGTYPMAAFTTDGVWALSPNQTGGWAAVKPFTRDVLLNEDPANILQLDRELLFATSRGIMLMSPSADGVQTECITDIFDGIPEKFFIISKTNTTSGYSAINGYQYIINKLLSSEDFADFTLTSTDICPSFKQFIKKARMLWDSTHQRIIIGNPDYKVAYVFNKADKLWTTTIQHIIAPVNSYPQCFATTRLTDATNGNKNLLVDFSRSFGTGTMPVIDDEDDATAAASAANLPVNGLIVSRPFHLDDPDALKTINSLIVRGQVKADHITTVLLGSRNLTHWHVLGAVNSSKMVRKHGSAYKYFRIIIVTRLAITENISHFDVDYINKLDNKLR